MGALMAHNIERASVPPLRLRIFRLRRIQAVINSCKILDPHSFGFSNPAMTYGLESHIDSFLQIPQYKRLRSLA